MDEQTQQAGGKKPDDGLDFKSTREFFKATPQYSPAVPLDRQALESAALAEPTRALITSLLEQLTDEVVLPLLVAQSREELLRGLGDRLGKYHTTMSALVVLVQTTPAGVALTKRAERKGFNLADAARKIGGEKTADEVAFSMETYASAMRIISRFSSLPSPSDTDGDQGQADRFNYGSTLHTLGTCMVAAVATGTTRATPVGISAAFEILRGGAVDAYIAARTALSLRQPPSVPSIDEPLPFDDEDIALATG
jgi:hypothetical protein